MGAGSPSPLFRRYRRFLPTSLLNFLSPGYSGGARSWAGRPARRLGSGRVVGEGRHLRRAVHGRASLFVCSGCEALPPVATIGTDAAPPLCMHTHTLLVARCSLLVTRGSFD